MNHLVGAPAAPVKKAPEFLMVPAWKLWLASLGRLVDGLVWMLSLGACKTTLNGNILAVGTQVPPQPLVISTRRDGRTIYMPRDKSRGAQVFIADYPRYVHIVHGGALFLDGLAGALSFGFVELDLSRKLPQTPWYQSEITPAVPGHLL